MKTIKQKSLGGANSPAEVFCYAVGLTGFPLEIAYTAFGRGASAKRNVLLVAQKV